MNNKTLTFGFLFVAIFIVAVILLFPLLSFYFSFGLSLVISSILTYGLMRLFIKEEESTQILTTRFMIRFFGVLLILSALPVAFMFTMGRSGKPPLDWYIMLFSSLGFFITGIGIASLMRWSWYSAIVLLPIFIICGIYFFSYSGNFTSKNFLLTLAFPGILFIFLLIPKVKEQFR